MEIRRFPEAVADFSALLKVNPSIAGYYDNRAHALAEIGRTGEAVADATEAVRLAPQYGFGYRTRGELYFASGRAALALLDFERGLLVEPGDVGMTIDRGRALSALGRDADAVASFSTAIELDPRAAPAYRERGLVYKKMGNFQAALNDLGLALDLDPADTEVGRALEEMRRPANPAPAPRAAAAVPVEPPSQKRGASSGTGFFVNDSGFVATNAHVVEDCRSINVTTSQGETVPASLAASDATNDLAALRTGLATQAVATIRSGVRLGESVAAFGFPFAGTLATSGNFTPGAVTALSGLGDDSRYLQISAPVQPGNSGGPLLDQGGTVVGVVSAKLNALKFMIANNGDIPQNVNFAIKGRVLANFLESSRVTFAEGALVQPLAAPDLADKATAMSVFILCQ